MKIVFSLLILFCFPVMGQDKPAEPKEIIKAFPPALSIKYADAQKNLQLADMQLKAAQATYNDAQSQVRLLLYQIADEINLTPAEKRECPISQNSNGAWEFRCPPPKPPPATDKKP